MLRARNEIGSLWQPGQATVQGRLRAAQVRPVPSNNVLAFEPERLPRAADRWAGRKIAGPFGIKDQRPWPANQTTLPSRAVRA